MIWATINELQAERAEMLGVCGEAVGYVFVVRKMMSKWVIGDQKLYDVALRWCEIWGSVGECPTRKGYDVVVGEWREGGAMPDQKGL